MADKPIGEQEAHNLGQEDGAQGVYNPPHSAVELLISGFRPFTDTAAMVKENEAYDKGHKNGSR